MTAFFEVEVFKRVLFVKFQNMMVLSMLDVASTESFIQVMQEI